MAKFDLENFRDYYLNLIKNNISAKLTAITAEKADSIPLPEPDASAYIKDINDGAINVDPFVHYGFHDVETSSQGHSIKWTPTMFFFFYFVEHGEGNVAENKVLRYTRAATEIILENSLSNSIVSAIQVNPIPPVEVKFSHMDGSPHKVGGLEIKGSFIL